MNFLPPISLKKIRDIRNKLKGFPTLNKYYGEWLTKALNEKEPRTYPIIKQFLMENVEYLRLLDQVLIETSTIKGFPTIIKHSKNKAEFYDELSILKFARKLKSMDYVIEFIPPAGGPRPDLKADMWKKEVFFEVKHLRDVEEASTLLFDYFSEYPSRFRVFIKLESTVTLSEIEKCIQAIKTTIETKEEKDFPQHLSLNCANAIIRLSKPRSRTPISVFSGARLISFERTKFKIQTTLHEAIRQLRVAPSTSSCFVVYDVDNWKIDFEDVERVLYGNRATDVTLNTLDLQKRLYSINKVENRQIHEKKIVEALKRDFYDVLRSSLIIPQFSYSFQNGLFFLDESSEINGVIVFRGDQHKLFPNPFVKDSKLVSHSKLVKMLAT